MTANVVARAQVRVPATTANLGAGFDHLGMALDKWLRVSAELRTDTHDDRGLITIHRTGTLADLDHTGLADPHADLIWKGFNAVELRLNGGNGFNGSVHFEANSDIPIARGLGSSAAALLAGAALANATLELGLTIQQLVQICADIEGHGDNVAAAAFGGAVLVSFGDEGKHFAPLPVHESLGFAFAVPDFETLTTVARAVLPPFIKFTDAVLAAARSAALVRALQSADSRLITAGLDDVLHVPYRKHLVPGYDRVVEAACSAGAFGATLSGSGSSIVAITPRAAALDIAECMANAWGMMGIDAYGFAAGVCHAGLSVVSPTYQPTDLPTDSPTNGPALPVRLPRSVACP